MFYRKKITAFVASLLICASTAVSPVYTFAENETDDIFLSEETTDAAEQDTYTSGDYTYSLTHDGTGVCIEGCKSTAESLVIPDTLDGKPVAELGPFAFGNDHENNPYVSISLPASLNYISDRNPFMYCTNLKEITVAEGSKDFCAENGILYSKSKDKLVHYPCCKTDESLAIPEGVKTLGTASIYNTRLQNIKFPSSLEEIGVFALGDTVRLQNIDLSGTKVDLLDTYAFSGCYCLEDVKLPDTLTNIGGGAFANCKALKKITFPDSLTTIGQYAFMDTGLTYAIIPDSVTSIGYCAFGYYTDKEGAVVANDQFDIVGSPSSAAMMYANDSDSDYEYQNNFDFITPEQYAEQQDLLDLEKIKSGDYEYAVTTDGVVLTLCSSEADRIEVPDTIDGQTISKIYPACFSTCTASEIILPDSIKELREMAFYNCVNLKSVTIPASVKTIGNNVFDSCTSLETVEICGAETMGEQVFCNCDALKKVTIAGCLKEWNDEEPFILCKALEEINIGEGDGEFSSKDGILYNKDKSTLKAYPANKAEKSFKAPASVTTIAQSAFANAQNLETVELPNVKVIKSYAFEECSALKKVKLSKDLTEIGSDAFYDCMSLKSLRVPKSLTTIGTCAFGFYHNESASADTSAATEEGAEATDLVVDGFKLYAPKDSTAYKFAKNSGIEVVANTIEIFGKNMDIRFLAVLGGIIAAAIIAVIGFATGKSIKKKKEEKALAERKAKSAERRKQQSAGVSAADSSEKTNKEDSANED